MLTKSEKRTYDFIQEYIIRENISPTLNEIALGINIKSKGTVSRYVQSLINLKLLIKNKDKHFSRNLALTNLEINKLSSRSSNIDNHYYSQVEKYTTLNIPLVGTIAAGKPIEAITEPNSCNISDMLKGDNLYMLKVKGDSMIEEGIFDGDYVVCEPAKTANNGDIIVALIDNAEATLKRVYLKQDKVLLCPANSSMSTMEYEANRVQIQGVLRCQLRNY